MDTCKCNTDSDVLLELGKAIISLSEESRFHFKVFMVNLVLFGGLVAQISSLAGVESMAM